GFGGCDAHLILEEFNAPYHGSLAASSNGQLAPRAKIAVVGISSLIPVPGVSGRFNPADVRLPAKVRILPDVADHMDRSHILAVRAAEPLVSALSKAWDKVRTETGIIIGFSGKTRRGIDASLRVYFDHLQRRLTELQAAGVADVESFERVRADLVAAIKRIPASGPYSLPGLMPNVMAGRVANAFNITGPNMV